MDLLNYAIGPGFTTRNTNPGCDVPADWELLLRWAIVNKMLKYTWVFGVVGHAGTYVEIHFGNLYFVQFEVVSINKSHFHFSLGNVVSPEISTPGVKTFLVESGANSNGGVWNLQNFYFFVDPLLPVDQVIEIDNVFAGDKADGLAYPEGFFPQDQTFAGVVDAAGNDKVYRLTNREGKTNVLIKVDPDAV